MAVSNAKDPKYMEELKIRKSTTAPIEDNEVVKRVLHGEKELFEILLRRYNQTLYRAIRSYLSHDTDVEDAMQDTYLKAYEKLAQYKGTAAFSTWLVRIGINEALLRIRFLTKERSLYSGEGTTTEKIIELPDRRMDPERKTMQFEMRRIVEKAIDQLPDKYKVIYMLREIEGMDNESIASCLSITDSNVKVRFHRAKSILKEALYKYSSKGDYFEFGNSRCDKVVEFVMKRI